MKHLLSLVLRHAKLIMTQQERPHLFTQRGLHAAKVDQAKQLLLLVCLRTQQRDLQPAPTCDLQHISLLTGKLHVDSEGNFSNNINHVLLLTGNRSELQILRRRARSCISQCSLTNGVSRAIIRGWVWMRQHVGGGGTGRPSVSVDVSR